MKNEQTQDKWFYQIEEGWKGWAEGWWLASGRAWWFQHFRQHRSFVWPEESTGYRSGQREPTKQIHPVFCIFTVNFLLQCTTNSSKDSDENVALLRNHLVQGFTHDNDQCSNKHKNSRNTKSKRVASIISKTLDIFSKNRHQNCTHQWTGIDAEVKDWEEKSEAVMPAPEVWTDHHQRLRRMALFLLFLLQSGPGLSEKWTNGIPRVGMAARVFKRCPRT